jgi:hypothetical protein
MKGKKELEGMLDKLNSMSSTVKGFEKGMNKKLKDISSPLDGFKDLSNSINTLRDIAAKTEAMSSSTDDSEDMELTLDTIWDMVDDTPNNMELGKKIRQFYHELQEATPDSMETTANEMKKENSEKITYSYESPDGGDTVYKREHGTDERVLVKDGEQLNVFTDNPDQLNLFDDTKE